MKSKSEQQSLVDERLSSITHAVGGFLGVAALVLSIVFAVQSETQVAWKIIGGAIFGSSIILLYTCTVPVKIRD